MLQNIKEVDEDEDDVAVQFGGTGSAEHKRQVFKVHTRGTKKFTRQRSRGQAQHMQGLENQDDESKIEEED